MINIHKTPQEEAAIVVELLEGWARTVNVKIDSFYLNDEDMTVPRSMAVLAIGEDGTISSNFATIEHCCDARDVDAAMVMLATSKGWARFQKGHVQ
jgi:hypothetical protein